MVYVHAFAEEMNKSRRMAALQARALAAHGYAVLQVDLYGCGDSAGEFGDARWEIWARDVRAAVDQLRNRFTARVSLWGLRLGATLASEIACDPALEIERLVLWQPVIAGEQFLSQFLRIRLAAEMLAAGAATSALRELRAELAQGRSLEIGGYDLHADLAVEIARRDMGLMKPAVKRVDWLEVGTAVRPASQRVIGHWKASGLDVRPSAVPGDPFWSTVEIAECPALLDATTEALR